MAISRWRIPQAQQRMKCIGMTHRNAGLYRSPSFHLPRSLKRAVLKGGYTVTINHDFAGVIAACAACSGKGREETWINPVIRDWFLELHGLGFAHSVEYRADGVLMGGLYGLCIGGAFFGESMFSRTQNASKIALVHLVARLYNRGFFLLDSQFVNDHLVQFGCHEIPREDYLERLTKAIQMPLRFVDARHEKITLNTGDLIDFLSRP